QRATPASGARRLLVRRLRRRVPRGVLRRLDSHGGGGGRGLRRRRPRRGVPVPLPSTWPVAAPECDGRRYLHAGAPPGAMMSRMAFMDLREWIAVLEKDGELRRIRAAVDWDREIGAVSRRVLEKKGPALLFERIKGYETGRSTRLFTGGL